MSSETPKTCEPTSKGSEATPKVCEPKQHSELWGAWGPEHGWMWSSDNGFEVHFVTFNDRVLAEKYIETMGLASDGFEPRLIGVNPAIRDERDALRAEVARLKTENAELAALAEEGQTRFEEALAEAHVVSMGGEPGQFTMNLKAKIVPLMAASLAELMKDHDAKNCLAWSMSHPQLGQLDLTLRRANGKTTEQLFGERDDQIASLQAEVARLRQDGPIAVAKPIAICDPVEVICNGIRYQGMIAGGELAEDGSQIRHDVSFVVTIGGAPVDLPDKWDGRVPTTDTYDAMPDGTPVDDGEPERERPIAVGDVVQIVYPDGRVSFRMATQPDLMQNGFLDNVKHMDAKIFRIGEGVQIDYEFRMPDGTPVQ